MGRDDATDSHSVFLWLTVLPPATALGGPTLDTVRANGVVRCGVSAGLLGFSKKDGSWPNGRALTLISAGP